MSPEYVRRTGSPPGFKPWHAAAAVALAVVWFGTLAFVLTHGRNEQSSVDVYSELPPGFTTQLQQQGVRYQGLSPVDGSVVRAVLSHATTEGGLTGGSSSPIVLRTSFTDHGTGASFTDQPALMVVVPETSSGSSGSSVFVAFVDPTTYKLLASLTYDASGVSR